MLTLLDLLAGGPGSGCNGPHCGRPRSAQSKLHQRVAKELERYAKKYGVGRVPKNALPPGLVRKGGLEHLPLKEPWAGRIKLKMKGAGGENIVVLKQAKTYEKRGDDWLRKPNKFKGGFLPDPVGGKTMMRTYNNPRELNHFFIHQASPSEAVSVEVHRNLGRKGVSVIERDLGQYHAIERHREVSFNNIGRAMGFLNKRYGITFKLKLGKE